MQPTGGGRPPT